LDLKLASHYMFVSKLYARFYSTKWDGLPAHKTVAHLLVATIPEPGVIILIKTNIKQQACITVEERQKARANSPSATADLQTENGRWCSTAQKTRMWANAQRDGRRAKYRWRPLFNAAKFRWRPVPECRAVTLPRRETRWN